MMTVVEQLRQKEIKETEQRENDSFFQLVSRFIFHIELIAPGEKGVKDVNYEMNSILLPILQYSNADFR